MKSAETRESKHGQSDSWSWQARRLVTQWANFSHLASRVASMNENRKLGDGVELVREDIFWPEGEWSIHRGEFIWSRVKGWQKYYEVKREESQFKSAKEAMAAWDSRSMTRQLEKDEACEFCYAPAVAVCIHCGTAVCEGCSETTNGRTVCNECMECEDSEFDAGGEG